MSTLERLQVIAHGLAAQFGPSCEVLIHDLQRDIDTSLVYIDICWGILVVIGGSISTTKDSLLNIIRYTSAGFH